MSLPHLSHVYLVSYSYVNFLGSEIYLHAVEQRRFLTNYLKFMTENDKYSNGVVGFSATSIFCLFFSWWINRLDNLNFVLCTYFWGFTNKMMTNSMAFCIETYKVTLEFLPGFNRAFGSAFWIFFLWYLLTLWIHSLPTETFIYICPGEWAQYIIQQWNELLLLSR